MFFLHFLVFFPFWNAVRLIPQFFFVCEVADHRRARVAICASRTTEFRAK